MEHLELIYKTFLNGAVICTDTRSITDGCIFFALKGANFNGNAFADKALDLGAALAIIDEPTNNHDDRLLFVDDVLTMLQQLATHHRMHLQIPFIGITGSNGKTTTKELVSRVLGEKYKTICTKGNLNNHIGVPLTLLSVNKNHEIAVVEMGANHQKEIEFLCALSRPTHVLITNVGKAHLEGFGGFEGVLKGKGEMYEYAKQNDATIFINDDNLYLKKMAGTFQKIIRYGTHPNCDITATPITDSAYVQLKWKTKNESNYHHISSKLTGHYNFENILSAITIGNYFEVTKEGIKNAVENYVPDNQRSQELKIGNVNILLDAYNANPTSMEAALRNFNENFKGKRAVFLGDMLELGTDTEKEHTAIISLIKSLKFDLVVLVGSYFKEAGKNFNAHYFNNSAEALAWMKSQDLKEYKVLIKGSRGSKMEVLLEGFKKT